MRHAQELVEQLAGEPEQLDIAREQTQAALKQVYSSVGWELGIVWEDGRAPQAPTALAPAAP